jgi:hypothetical protein
MPGPSCRVTTRARQLHSRLPGAGLMTFLSRVTCIVPSVIIILPFSVPAQASICPSVSTLQPAYIPAAVPIVGLKAVCCLRDCNTYAHLEAGAEVQITQRRLQPHDDVVPLGSLLLLLLVSAPKAKAAPPKESAGISHSDACQLSP